MISRLKLWHGKEFLWSFFCIGCSQLCILWLKKKKRNILAGDWWNINFFLGVKIYKFVKIICNRETLQSTLQNSVTFVCVIFVYCICILYFLWSFIQVCVQWRLLCFILFFLIILVTWTGNFSLLAWLAISVCCKISEVRRFFRQPTTWHVSLFGTTGYFICRGNKCILLNVASL